MSTLEYATQSSCEVLKGQDSIGYCILSKVHNTFNHFMTELYRQERKNAI